MIPARHRILVPNDAEIPPPRGCALAIMTKAPRAGQVKTRLTPPLTPEEAAALNICFLRDTAAAISAAGENAQGVACYTPIGAGEAYADILPANFELIAQKEGTLGERLYRAVEDLFAVGFTSVCLINSDSPTVPASSFAEAVRWLSQPNDRVVLGPSDDGGYYLIGLKRPKRRLFERIDWSTERVFQQTIERAKELKLEVKLLPGGFDVDDHRSLRRLCEELLGSHDPGENSTARSTEEFLRAFVAQEGSTRLWPVEETPPDAT